MPPRLIHQPLRSTTTTTNITTTPTSANTTTDIIAAIIAAAAVASSSATTVTIAIITTTTTATQGSNLGNLWGLALRCFHQIWSYMYVCVTFFSFYNINGSIWGFEQS